MGEHAPGVLVRPVRPADAETWARLRAALWPGDDGAHRQEVAAFFAGERRNPQAVLIAEDASGEIVGFVELSIRNYAEECETDRVAYLEGWYVVPQARRRGVGRALVAAGEAWGRAQGCTEFGSDADAANDVSAGAHRALGFEETGQIRTFKKGLPRE